MSRRFPNCCSEILGSSLTALTCTITRNSVTLPYLLDTCQAAFCASSARSHHLAGVQCSKNLTRSFHCTQIRAVINVNVPVPNEMSKPSSRMLCLLVKCVSRILPFKNWVRAARRKQHLPFLPLVSGRHLAQDSKKRPPTCIFPSLVRPIFQSAFVV
jgi:hypothetical protein